MLLEMIESKYAYIYITGFPKLSDIVLIMEPKSKVVINCILIRVCGLIQC